MDEIYTTLAERLNHPKSTYLLQILQKIITPEEGRMLFDLRLPPAELAAKLIRNEEEVDSRIRDLWCRGLLWATPNEGCYFPSDAVWLHDISLLAEPLDPEVRQLWKDWYETEWAGHIAKQLVRSETPVIRLVPSPQSLDAFSKVSTEPVLPYEDPRQIVEAVDLIALRNYCVCRIMIDCGHPLNNCLQFNEYAEYDISRGFARKISVDEAVDALNMSAETGLVHLLSNRAEVSRLRSICNCCECACIVVNSVKRYGTLRKVISKTRYEATVDDEACDGCQLCIDICNFDAIDMVKPEGSKKYKAVIDSEKCWGCGVCYTACESEAISLKLVRPVTHIPTEVRA